MSCAFFASRASVPAPCRGHGPGWPGLYCGCRERPRCDGFHEEPQHARVQLAHMPEFKQTVALRLGQRLAVILAVAQLRESGQHHLEDVRVAGLKRLQEFPNGTSAGIRLVKLYGEFHSGATLILVFRWRTSTQLPAYPCHNHSSAPGEVWPVTRPSAWPTASAKT